jgi:two-component system alkaline phosphatase synthesis response regulator PhoP
LEYNNRNNNPRQKKQMSKILVVDDEAHIIELVRLYLEREGYEVDEASNGNDAVSKQRAGNPNLILLDLMLPDIDGYEVCRQIRTQSNTPILMLTARKEDIDKIVGLELGADDYLTKPFNPRELVARVRAILRRYQAGQQPGDIAEMGKLRVDFARQEVTVNSRPVKLRTKEFSLLSTFIRNSGIVLSREKLLEDVWGFDYYGESRTVDVHVNHLRDKLAGAGVQIETIRGTGYKITVGDEKE